MPPNSDPQPYSPDGDEQKERRLNDGQRCDAESLFEPYADSQDSQNHCHSPQSTALAHQHRSNAEPPQSAKEKGQRPQTIKEHVEHTLENKQENFSLGYASGFIRPHHRWSQTAKEVHCDHTGQNVSKPGSRVEGDEEAIVQLKPLPEIECGGREEERVTKGFGNRPG